MALLLFAIVFGDFGDELREFLLDGRDELLVLPRLLLQEDRVGCRRRSRRSRFRRHLKGEEGEEEEEELELLVCS